MLADVAIKNTHTHIYIKKLCKDEFVSSISSCNPDSWLSHSHRPPPSACLYCPDSNFQIYVYRRRCAPTAEQVHLVFELKLCVIATVACLASLSLLRFRTLCIVCLSLCVRVVVPVPFLLWSQLRNDAI